MGKSRISVQQVGNQSARHAKPLIDVFVCTNNSQLAGHRSGSRVIVLVSNSLALYLL